MPPRDFRTNAAFPRLPIAPTRGPALRRFMATPKRSLKEPVLPATAIPPRTEQSKEAIIAEKARAFSEVLDTTNLELAQEAELKRSKKKLLHVPKRLLQVCGILLLAVGLWYFYGRPGIKLSEYAGESYSISIPLQYEQTSSFGSTTFKEQSGSDDKRSMIVVLEPISGGSDNKSPGSSEAVAANFDLVQQTLPQTLQAYIGGNRTIEKAQFDKTSHDGNNAFIMHSKVLANGKPDGDITALVVYDNAGIYTVAVYANNSDKDLARASKRIINSLNVHALAPTTNTP